MLGHFHCSITGCACYSMALCAGSIEQMMMHLSARTQKRNMRRDTLSFAWQTSIGRSVQALGATGFHTPHNIHKHLGVFMPTDLASSLTKPRRLLYLRARTLIHILDPQFAANDDWVVQFSLMTDSNTHYVRQHVDDMDITFQYALQLGSPMEGGLLRTWSSKNSFTDTNYWHKIIRFDGRLPHEVVGAFQGHRANIIFYKVYDRNMPAPANRLPRVQTILDLRSILPTMVGTLPYQRKQGLTPIAPTRKACSRRSLLKGEETPTRATHAADQGERTGCPIVAISGPSGSGKSTIVRVITNRLRQLYPGYALWSQGALKGTLYNDNSILVVGTHYETTHLTPGTDRLSMTVAPQLLHLLQFPPPSLQCILFEGNGMKSLTTSTVDAIIQRRGIVVVLDVTSGVLKSRQKTRDVLDNRVRSISWLAGDNTRASNVAKQACRNCCTVKNDTETDLIQNVCSVWDLVHPFVAPPANI